MQRTKAGRATVDVLNKLIALAYTGIDLCQLGLGGRLLPDSTQELQRLRADHRRHISSLMLLIDTLGGRISATTLWQPLLPSHKQTVSPLLNDVAFLQALAENETRAHALCEGLLSDPALPVTVRGVVSGNMSNGRFHLSWLLERLMREAPSGLDHGAARA